MIIKLDSVDLYRVLFVDAHLECVALRAKADIAAATAAKQKCLDDLAFKYKTLPLSTFMIDEQAGTLTCDDALSDAPRIYTDADV